MPLILPDPAPIQIDLVLVDEQDRVSVSAGHVPHDDPEPVLKFEIWRPEAIALTIDNIEGMTAGGSLADIRAALQSQPYTYTLIRTGANFPSFHADLPKLTKSWIDIHLSPGTDTEEPAIAWSMAPMRLASPTTIAKSANINAALDFVSLNIGTQRSGQGDVPWLEALGNGTSRPQWEFHQTPYVSLSGSQDLWLIVRHPADAGTADIRWGATVSHRRWYRPWHYASKLGSDGRGSWIIYLG